MRRGKVAVSVMLTALLAGCGSARHAAQPSRLGKLDVQVEVIQMKDRTLMVSSDTHHPPQKYYPASAGDIV